MKLSNLIRPGYRIEVGCTVRRRRGDRGCPGYQWVQGWQVFNPATGRWSVEMRHKDAIAFAKEIKVRPT